MRAPGLPNWEADARAKRSKASKRNRGFPGGKYGAASKGRILSGAELEASKQRLFLSTEQERKEFAAKIREFQKTILRSFL